VTPGLATRTADGHVHCTVLDTPTPQQRATVAASKAIYTDGSFAPRQPGAHAGYAFVQYRLGGPEPRLISATYGRVQTTPTHPLFRGARVRSNNAGEMTALLRAIEEEIQEPKDTAVVFHVDSMTAINLALGKTLPRKSRGENNRELARNLRSAYRRLHASRPEGFVRIVHVRAHTGVPGNEAADRMANRGASLQHDHEQHTIDIREHTQAPKRGDG